MIVLLNTHGHIMVHSKHTNTSHNWFTPNTQTHFTIGSLQTHEHITQLVHSKHTNKASDDLFNLADTLDDMFALKPRTHIYTTKDSIVQETKRTIIRTFHNYALTQTLLYLTSISSIWLINIFTMCDSLVMQTY